jgi:lipoate---protein ligase
MQYLDLTADEPEENLRIDDRLLEAAECGEGAEVLRTWESVRPFVVLGLGGKIEDDVHVDQCAADAVPVLRRRSGGGTVLQGKGSLSFSLILRKGRHEQLDSISGTNRWVLERIRDTLRTREIAVDLHGVSDLTLGGRKVSGNAQRRKREWILFHGTLIYALDFELVERYLKLPPRRPEYRGNRGHRDFLTNLPLGPLELRQVVCEAFGNPLPKP